MRFLPKVFPPRRAATRVPEPRFGIDSNVRFGTFDIFKDRLSPKATKNEAR